MIIDFHSHVLPGIDDGSRNTGVSIDMLKRASVQGVELMIATPHFYASRMTIDVFLERRKAASDRLCEAIKESGETGLPRLISGAEVAYFEGISRAERIGELTISGTDILLLELPFGRRSSRVVKEVEELVKKRGLRVILAHLERYKDAKEFWELSDSGVYVQINAESLTSMWEGRRLCRMFKEGRAQLLGSDCHGINHRVPNLAEGRRAIEKRCGKDVLDRIDRTGTALIGENVTNFA